MDASEFLRLALAFFLVITGLGLAYLLWRMAGLFQSLTSTVDRSTDEVVPILTKAQTTMDGVNQEIGRVDEIMVSAVGATKGAERAVSAVSTGVTAPIRKLSGVAAGLQEAVGTFRSRMASDAAARAAARSPATTSAAPAAPSAAAAATTPPSSSPPPPDAPPPDAPAPAPEPTSGAGRWAEARARRARSAADSARALRKD